MLQQSETYLFVSQEEIRSNGEMRAKHDLLMHGVDAVIDRFVRRGERNRLAFPIHLTAGAYVDAGEQLDQRRFAGPVFADNGMDFTCLEDQINSLERVGGAKSLIKLLENQKRRAN